MQKENFSHITNLESMSIDLKRTEDLIGLLFEEIDQGISASMSKEAWKCACYSERASISEALTTAIYKNIVSVKEQLNNMIEVMTSGTC